jgi:hypothetical protein
MFEMNRDVIVHTEILSQLSEKHKHILENANITP